MRVPCLLVLMLMACSPAPVSVEAPTVTAQPAEGSFIERTTVTLTSSLPATIYASTDGADPRSTSRGRLEGPSPLKVDLTQTSTLRFFASVNAVDGPLVGGHVGARGLARQPLGRGGGGRLWRGQAGRGQAGRRGAQAGARHRGRPHALPLRRRPYGHLRADRLARRQRRRPLLAPRRPVLAGGHRAARPGGPDARGRRERAADPGLPSSRAGHAARHHHPAQPAPVGVAPGVGAQAGGAVRRAAGGAAEAAADGLPGDHHAHRHRCTPTSSAISRRAATCPCPC